MKLSRKIEAASRLILFAVTLLTSAYCLLCYIPFTWKQFISFRLYPVWLEVFLRFHILFFWAALAPCLWSLYHRDSGRERKAALPGIVWFGFELVLGAAVTSLPLLQVENNSWALALSLFSWAPLIFWEAALMSERLPALSWQAYHSGDEVRRLLAAIYGSFYVYAVYSAAYLFGLQLPWSWLGVSAALGWSLIAHLLVFVFILAVLDAAAALGGLFPSRARAESGLTALLFVFGLGFVVQHFVFAALNFNGLPAAAVSMAWSLGAAASLLGQAAAIYSDGSPVRDSVEFLTAAPRAVLSPLSCRAGGRALFLGLAAFVPELSRRFISRQDWNGMIEMLVALLFWSVCFIFFHSGLVPRGSAGTGLRAWRVAAFAATVAWCADVVTRAWDNDLRLKGVNVRSEIRRLSEGDLSYRAARRIFSGAPALAGSDFYQFLQKNTNLSRDIPIEPAEVRLVNQFGPGLSKKPNIFIFVVDSLRQDYLGAYNPKVLFTPAIDAFAAESLVWRRSFTAYGATGLSQPSIWTGSRLIHKQYVTPFYPMNSLEKLLDHEKYSRYITMDPVLTALLKPSPLLEPLDANNVISYEFCVTLAELKSKLAARKSSEPFFVYTQPQDVHISVISRAGNNNVTGKEYPGFYAPYAGRVESLDACFGRFVADLKQLGLYDDSVIVLTSDHGDSLGEGERWGHAYTLFPEVVRVPLIMRVPERLLEGAYRDLDALAFLTDITPTLYTLLGHGPIAEGELYGRSLLPRSRAEFEAAAKPDHLLASSYGPVYGLLRDNGRYLYIADGVNYAGHYYDLSRDFEGRNDLFNPQIADLANPEIRRRIEGINRFYKYGP